MSCSMARFILGQALRIVTSGTRTHTDALGHCGPYMILHVRSQILQNQKI